MASFPVSRKAGNSLSDLDTKGIKTEMLIREDDLRGPDIATLLDRHLDVMAEHSPPESRHALDLDGLRAESITFWTAWDNNMLLGCGALKSLGAKHGEIKSMHTAAEHRGKGIARQILQHIIGVARDRTYERVSLETGSMAAFAPARTLYEQFGLRFTSPFGDYVEDPNSVFMTLKLPVST